MTDKRRSCVFDGDEDPAGHQGWRIQGGRLADGSLGFHPGLAVDRGEIGFSGKLRDALDLPPTQDSSGK